MAFKGEEFRPIPNTKWEISDRGRVQHHLAKWPSVHFVRDGEVYVEIADSEGRYIDVKLADLITQVWPENTGDRD